MLLSNRWRWYELISSQCSKSSLPTTDCLQATLSFKLRRTSLLCCNFPCNCVVSVQTGLKERETTSCFSTSLMPQLSLSTATLKVRTTIQIGQNSHNYENNTQCSWGFIFYILLKKKLQYFPWFSLKLDSLSLVILWNPLKDVYCPHIPSLRTISAVHMFLWAVCLFSQQTNVQTLGRMPKDLWREMFKAPASHTNENPLLSHSNTPTHAHTSTHSHSVHKHLATDTPLVPYASVPANYKRSNQFHHGPVQGNRLQWHQLHGRCLCTWQPLTHKQGPSQPALCCSPPQGQARRTTACSIPMSSASLSIIHNL